MPPPPSALLRAGRHLRATGYHFVTVTPSTHARHLRTHSVARNTRDVFGWNLRATTVDDELRDALDGDRPLVRFSSLDDRLFVHSPFPTTARDAVFFGPDTYRFVGFLHRLLAGRPRVGRLVEIGCGSGAAAIICARYAEHVSAGDVNPRALEYTAINAELNGVALDIRESDILAGFEGEFEMIIANPPYLVDDEARLYRDGGGALGLGVTLRILEEGSARLARSGCLAIYSGTPIIEGRDPLREAVFARFPDAHYQELDPDVFSEELSRPAYAAADRIAVVGICIERGGITRASKHAALPPAR